MLYVSRALSSRILLQIFSICVSVLSKSAIFIKFETRLVKLIFRVITSSTKVSLDALLRMSRSSTILELPVVEYCGIEKHILQKTSNHHVNIDKSYTCLKFFLAFLTQ